MDQSRDLLFGILAAQMRFVTSEALLEAAACWSVNQSQSLAETLVASKALLPQDRDFIETVLDRLIQRHEGDSTLTLEVMGGKEQVYLTYKDALNISHSSEASTLIVPPEAKPPELEIPSGVREAPGRYTHISEFGRGGMGRILLTHDRHLGRDIALKELLPSPDSGSPAEAQSPVRLSVPYIARFLQEARITGQLEHPSIVPVYELGHRQDGTLYYTMKLVRGKTLSQALKGADGLQARLKLIPHFMDLCNAMAYAHSRGVIHRDLKPGNVMVGEFGETVVIDWGLAKAREKEDIHARELSDSLKAIQLGEESEAVKTAYGFALGTPAYMAPEQAKGDLDRVDKRSDVYSLGAVLYELLTGHPPFDGTSIRDILNKVISEAPVPVAVQIPEAPPELVAICRRALYKEPARRYSTAEELSEEVRRFMSGALVQSYEYKPSELVRRYVRRHKAVLGTSAVAAVLLLGFSIYYNVRLIQSSNREREQRIAAQEAERTALTRQREAEQAQRSSQRAAYRSSILLAQQLLKDGHLEWANEVLWGTDEEMRNWEWGYLLLTANRLCFWKETDPYWGEISPASFSPDSSRFAWSDHMPGTIWESVSGKPIIGLSGGETSMIHGISLSPDGMRILRFEQGYTTVLDAGSGKELSRLELDSCPRLSGFDQESSQILTASYSGKVMLWKSNGGEKRIELANSSEPIAYAFLCAHGSRVLSVSTDKTARLWDSTTRRLVSEWKEISKSEVSLNGERIVIVSTSGQVSVHDAATGAALLRCDVPANLAAISPDGQSLLVVPNSSRTLAYDITTNRQTLEFRLNAYDHLEAVAIQYSPDGRRVVLGFADGSASLWNLSNATLICALPAPNGTHSFNSSRSARGEPESMVMAFASKGDRLAIKYRNFLGIWDVSLAAESVQGIASPDRGFGTARFSPDAMYVLTAPALSTDSPRLWDAQSGELVCTLQSGSKDARYCYRAIYSPVDSGDAVALNDNKVEIWDTHRQIVRKVLQGPSSQACDAAYSSDGKLIACIYEDGGVVIWDVSAGTILQRLEGLTEDAVERVLRVVFRPGANQVLTSEGKIVRLRDFVGGVELLNISGFADVVCDVAFSPDGKRLLVAAGDGSMRVHDVVDGKKILDMRGHAAGVTSAVYSPDGQRVLSASHDGLAKIWDAETGEELCTIFVGGTMLADARFSTDGQQVLVSGGIGDARILTAAPWRLADSNSQTGETWQNRFAIWQQKRHKIVTTSELVDTFSAAVAAADASSSN